MKNQSEKIFIVFEGHDGVGKTTLAEMLKVYLEEIGYSAGIFYSVPDRYKDFRKQIEDLDDLEMSFWFYILFGLLSVGEAMKSEYDILVFDRYVYSTIVSHSLRGFAVQKDKMVELFPKPSLTFYINAKRETMIDRVTARESSESERKKDLAILSRQKLLIDAGEEYKSFSIIPIDNDGDISVAFADIARIVQEILPQ